MVTSSNPFGSAYSLDDILTPFGLATIKDRYMKPGETPSEMMARASIAYSGGDMAFAKRMYERATRGHIVYPTPVLINASSSKRGLPMSCYTSEVGDSLESIIWQWSMGAWMAANGGGIGTYVGRIRSMGEEIASAGVTSGLMPFLRVDNELTRSISQGSIRRGSKCIYLDVYHPELMHFLYMRSPSGGDPQKKTLDLHHAVCIPDEFMHAVDNGADWNFKSPATGAVVSSLPARRIWAEILERRMTTGEPMIMFTDTANKWRTEVQKKLNLKINTSNLCTEIMLPTGIDHHGIERYGVCCLIGLNFEKYDEWGDGKDPNICLDISRFGDNMMNEFIKLAPSRHLEDLVYSVKRQRSLGAGAAGIAAYFQLHGIPFGSAAAQAINKNFFKQYRMAMEEASLALAEELGPCEDGAEAGLNIRFSNMIAVAPNASSAIIAGETSPGIDPYTANVFQQKTLSGTFVVVNKYLKKLLLEKYSDKVGEVDSAKYNGILSSISLHEGSVQHLDWMDEEDKKVFKTAFEIDQMWIIKHASDRAPYIDQAQPVNIFVPADIRKDKLHEIHYAAWSSKTIKTMYYCRSMTKQRADKVSISKEPNNAPKNDNPSNFEECLSCQ